MKIEMIDATVSSVNVNSIMSSYNVVNVTSIDNVNNVTSLDNVGSVTTITNMIINTMTSLSNVDNMTSLVNVVIDNNDTFNSTENFPSLFENRPSKIFCAIYALIISMIDIGLMSGIVWYEHFGSDDSKRTLVNKLVSSVCLSFIAVLLVCLTDIIRYFSGPLPQAVCLAQVIIKNTLMRQAIMFFVAIVITRYVFIICLKNPGAVQDNFWNRFLGQWIVGFCLGLNFVVYFLPGRQPLNYYTCSNTDPTKDLYFPRKPYLLLDLIGILVYAFVKIRIMIFNKSTKNEVETICPKNIFLAEIEDKSITDFTSGIVSLCFFTSFSMTIGKLNSMTKDEFNSGSNYIWMFMAQLIGPGTLIFIFSVLHYIRHAPLRETVFKELKYAIIRDSSR